MIEDDLGYTFDNKVLTARDFGVAQNRKRIDMVGLKDPIHFDFPEPTMEEARLEDNLETNVGEEFFLSQRYLDTLKKHRARHEGKGNGFGYLILDRKKGIANTLVIGGMGRERNLIVDEQSFRKCKRKDANTEAVRCLTPREFLNLQ